MMSAHTVLKLNDGWTQIPPKLDGVYWFQFGKPWHPETAYMYPMLMKIHNGERLLEMDDDRKQWVGPDCNEHVCPVWDKHNEMEMLIAWREIRVGEDFDHLPPQITGTVYERHPVACPKCNGLGAVYRVQTGPVREAFPFICYTCDHSEFAESFYSMPRISE